MRIAQLIHTLSYGDAISGEALAMQRCFSEMQNDSQIYSINTHPLYKSLTKKYTELDQDFDGVVILHYSLGSPLNDLYSALKSAKRILIFHNLTPVKYFASINPRVAQDILKGWDELPALCRISDRVISDSSFNANELRHYGIESKVLPLPFDPERWKEPANEGIVNLVKSSAGLNIMHVGRLAPNKCIEDIIKAFYYLFSHLDKNARLWIVGIDIDTELYSFSVKRLADELGISDVINFTGPLADSEIKALYQNCSAYLCMSEHEGFCVPLVEAMYFGLPVIAYNCSAIEETVGSGGILFNEKRFPEIAQLLYKVSCDSEFRKSVVEHGAKRVTELSYDRFKDKLENLLL